MGSKQKETVLGQKDYFEAKLNERRSYLTEKGLAPEMIAKDSNIKKIQSRIRETNVKLKAIAEIERTTKELAKIKAERLAPAQKEKKGKDKKPKGAPEKSKENKRKTPKESPEKGKEEKKESETDE